MGLYIHTYADRKKNVTALTTTLLWLYSINVYITKEDEMFEDETVIPKCRAFVSCPDCLGCFSSVGASLKHR